MKITSNRTRDTASDGGIVQQVSDNAPLKTYLLSCILTYRTRFAYATPIIFMWPPNFTGWAKSRKFGSLGG